MPNFLVCLKRQNPTYLIIETKGYDPLAEVKAQAARRWVNAVDAAGKYGAWHYAMAMKPEEVAERMDATVLALQAEVLPPAGIALQ